MQNIASQRAAAKFVPVSAIAAGSASMDFTGYASLFGAADAGGDVVMPGAFKTSLGRRGVRAIRMLFQHDAGQPIGVWEDIREDATGLFVKGRLIGEVAKARELSSLIAAGAVDGLSIGFRALKARRDAATGIRRLYEIDLWEISIVTFPMLPGARLGAAKPASPLAAKLRLAASQFSNALTERG